MRYADQVLRERELWQLLHGKTVEEVRALRTRLKAQWASAQQAGNPAAYDIRDELLAVERELERLDGSKEE